MIRKRDVYGLSPRARGIHLQYEARSVSQGSIPACAGNTNNGHMGLVLRRVYPRVRGEYAFVAKCASAVGGLSPRARGILTVIYKHAVITGSIPACAGNTMNAELAPLHAKVYPRVRGEYFY